MKLIKLGKIVSSFGNKGEIKLNPLTDIIDRFDFEGPYFLKDGKDLYIERYRHSKNQVIIKFKSVNSINDALDLKDLDLYVKEEDRAELDEGDYYVDQVLGLEVYSSGDYLGKVEEVIYTDANDVYIIRSDKTSYAVPAVKSFIKNIDLDKGTMEINFIEGMEYEV